MFKRGFPKQKMAILSPKKFFGKKPLKPFFRGPFTPHLHKKSEKSNEAILHKVQKTLFLGSFLPKFAPTKFYRKSVVTAVNRVVLLEDNNYEQLLFWCKKCSFW